MGGLSGKHFRLCNSVSFVAVLVKGLQSQSGCARLVIILCGFGSFSVIVFCFVFLFMYFSFSSELLFNSIGYGSLPACLPAWLFPLPACMTVSTACTWPFCLLPHMAATIGISALLSFPGPPLCTGPLTNCRLYCTPCFGRQVSHAFPAGQPAQEFCAWYTGGGRCWAWGVASSWAHARALHEHLHAGCWVAVGGQGHSG